MENEVQGSPIALAKDEAKGNGVEGMHPELDLELRGTLVAHHQLTTFT